MKKVYLETTIVSYLASRDSSDPRIFGMQSVTKDWWNYRREYYHLLISQVVIDEISTGDVDQANKRFSLLKGIDVIAQSDLVVGLAKSFIEEKIIPPKAALDALHIAYAAMSGADALLTWNCKHLANLDIQRALYRYLALRNIECPVICTPFELMEEVYE